MCLVSLGILTVRGNGHIWPFGLLCPLVQWPEIFIIQTHNYIHILLFIPGSQEWPLWKKANQTKKYLLLEYFQILYFSKRGLDSEDNWVLKFVNGLRIIHVYILIHTKPLLSVVRCGGGEVRFIRLFKNEFSW